MFDQNSLQALPDPQMQQPTINQGQTPAMGVDNQELRKRQMLAQMLMGGMGNLGSGLGPVGGAAMGALGGYAGKQFLANTPYKG